MFWLSKKILGVNFFLLYQMIVDKARVLSLDPMPTAGLI
jgi:hypothetical protein